MLNRNGATSETRGALSTEKGMGRQTASVERPTRVVSITLSTPSPERAEMREARPWPTVAEAGCRRPPCPLVMAIWPPSERCAWVTRRLKKSDRMPLIVRQKARPMNENPQLSPALMLRRLAFVMRVSRALYAAAELGLADILATGPMTSEELATKVEVNPGAMRRLMRALV